VFCASLLTITLLLFPVTPQARAIDTIPGTQSVKLRVALIGFTRASTNNASTPLETALAVALSRDERVLIIDQSMMRAALTGIGYDGSINLRREEARRISAAIGCDFFMIGKTEALTRSEREGESHEEAYAAVMIVDGRPGALATFDFVSAKAPTREAALKSLLASIDSRGAGYVDQMIQLRSTGSLFSNREPASPDAIEDVPDEGSSRAVGFTPPEFLNRVKPDYTPPAELADITATVEALVVFRASGEVGAVEITRWAGFGLDESAERAMRQLKFKPATRDGKPVNVRALMRYNFRRLSEANERAPQPSPEPPAPTQRDLRQLFKPTYRRP
jgi:TonB family protein